MHGFVNHNITALLVREHQDRLRREAGRARLYREHKRLRLHRRSP